MARRALTEEEYVCRIRECVGDIAEEWRRFARKMEEFTVAFRNDVDREEWEGAREMFAIFKTYIRNRTTESVQLKTTREKQGAK
jgi:heme oxygenase